MKQAKKAGETASEALGQARHLNQEIKKLKSGLEKQSIVLESLWELFKSERGLDDNRLREAMKEVQSARLSRVSAPSCCASCGRALQRDSPLCIYCGAESKIDDAPFPGW